MSDQLQIPGQDVDADGDFGPDGDVDGPWPGGLGQGPTAVVGLGDPGPATPKPSNIPAVAGFALAVFVWPAGLVLSVIGLVKSRRPGGTGRGLSIFGLVVSVLVGALLTTFIVVVSHSTAHDPGCTARLASSDAGYPAKLYRDDNTLQQDENKNDAAAVKADTGTYISDLLAYKAQLDHAITVSVHPSVKSAFGTVDDDVNTLATGYQQIEAGVTGQQNRVMAAADRLGPDAAAITNLCSSL